MKFLRLFLPVFLFASIAATVVSPAAFADEPVSHRVTNDDKSESPEILYTRILTSSLPAITAGPGETVHKEFVVETETVMTDGTTVRGETVISMSVSNTTISQVKSGDAINITKTCTAFINESGRNYEGGVYWGYTYAVQAWYIGYVLINHSTDAGSGWNTDWDGKLNDWTPPNPYVTGSIRGDFWKGNFGNTLWKRHRIQWGLSNTGTCSAQGFISS